MIRRARRLLVLPAALGLFFTAGFAQGPVRDAGKLPTIISYKTPTCGCCTKWEDHVRAAGFTVESRDVPELYPIKKRHGIPYELMSCHTALVDGYVVEGHIPADVIQKLLKERPTVRGIAVPGMPMGSPGMEGPYREKYDVLTFDKAGRTAVFASRE